MSAVGGGGALGRRPAGWAPGRRSCGITPISVIRSSAVAGRGGEMAKESPLAGSPVLQDLQTVGIRLGKIISKKLH